MSTVNLIIHGRTYGVGCDEGQERRVRDLGQYIDRRVRDIAQATGGSAAAESHLLVLACLVMADDLFDTRDGQTNVRSQSMTHNREMELLQVEIEKLQRQVESQVDETEAMRQLSDDRAEQINRMQAQMTSLEDQVESLESDIVELEDQLTAPTPMGSVGFLQSGGEAANSVTPDIEEKIAGTIEALAGRLEGIAKKLQAA